MNSASVRGNIGPRGRRARLILGIIALALGIALVVSMEVRGSPRLWRLAALPLLWTGCLAVIEAQRSTCVVLARRRIWDFDQGPCPVPDPTEAESLFRRGREVTNRATLIAAVLVLIALAVP